MIPDRLKGLLPREYLQVGQILWGTFTRNLLRGLLKILVFGFLAPQAMGILRAVFSFFKILTSLVGFGLDSTMVTFVSAAIKRGDPAERGRILRIVLRVKLLTVLILVAAGNAFAPQITLIVLGDPALTVYARLVFFAVGGQLLWRYISSYLSAHQEFGKLSVFLTTMPLLMLVVAGALMVADHFTLPAAILIYLFAPAVAALLWWPALQRTAASSSVRDWALVRRIFRFSRWVYMSTLASNARSHLNPLLLKNPRLSGSLAAGEANAGLYSFGNDLANEITVFTESLVTVLLPKASRKSTGSKLRQFVKRSYKHLLPLLVALVPVVFVAKPLILVLAQVKQSYLEYLPSVQVFAVLYIGTLFSLAAVPMQTALYAMKLPHIETYLETAMIVLLVGGGILFIPRYGTMGAAVVVLIQRLVSFIVVTGYGLVRLRRFETSSP